MADRREEIQKFVRSNWKLLLGDEFHDRLYKKNKRDWFYDSLRNQVGIPKDTEIAAATLDYLIKINHFGSSDELRKAFRHPFFAKNISDQEYYLQKYENSKDYPPDINLRALKEKEFKHKLYEQAKEAVKSDFEEFKETRQKQTFHDPIPSVLDDDSFYPEPTEIKEQQADETKYLPWWKKLRLKADPFPTKDGLGNIQEDQYEEIIIKTSIYEKYVTYIRQTPEELFKNIVFYGQFGSGKTTLFEYLQKPMIHNKIYPVLIRLSTEPDYQNFLIRFKQKLLAELHKIYQNLSGGAKLPASIETYLLDEGIRNLLRQIYTNYSCSGIVIMIDDIYKNKNYNYVGLMFLNHLQTFKGELTKETGIGNISFFISAPLEWEHILNDDLSYSGSVTKEESMPMITMQDALAMLNNRIRAFATNGWNVKELKIEFIQQIYRQLESKNALTFREFIKETVREFENGNFDILTSNPVAIAQDTIKEIRTLFEQDFTVNTGIKKVRDSPMSTRNKEICFQVLMRTYLQKGVSENSEFFRDNIFYFSTLKPSGLLIKTRNEKNEIVWKICPELARLNERVYSQYSYSLEDYFFRIVKSESIVADTIKNIDKRDEIIKCQRLLNEIKDRKSTEFDIIRFLVNDSLKLHKEIVRQLNSPSIKLNPKRLEKDCHRSIELISRAVAVFSGYRSISGFNDFWKDFWYLPDSVSEYIERISSEDSNPNREWYIGSAYDSAFSDIVQFLDDQLRKTETFSIPINGLKSEEIREFDKAREHLRKREYVPAVRTVSELVESKIREFLYNVFILQYGEEQYKRMRRIPDDKQQYILKNIRKDQEGNLAISRNEFLYLNRHDYSYVIRGPKGSPGEKNWIHTFSKIFSGRSSEKMNDYLYQFASFNLISAHYKVDSLTHEQQTNILTYIMTSIDFVKQINQSYVLFLKEVQKVETGGVPRYSYFFSLDKCKDLSDLQAVSVNKEDARRLTEMWKRAKQNHFDLSNQQQLEQKYGISYRQLCAVLGILLKEKPLPTELENIRMVRENSPIIVVEI